jgi:hypothetical protein
MKFKICNLLIYTAGIVYLSMGAISCNNTTGYYKQYAGKKEINYPQKVDTVIAKSGINSVLLKLPKPVDPLVTKVGIFWNLKRDSVKAKFPSDSDTLRIGLDSFEINGLKKHYTFDVFTYNNTGDRSVGTEVGVDIYGKEAAPGKFTNIKVQNIPGGAQLFYTLSKTNNLEYVKAVYYTKANGKKVVKANRNKKSLTVKGFTDTKAHKIRLYAVSTVGFQSKSDTVTIHPFILFDRTGWKIHSVDSQQGGIFKVTNILDGDPGTIWATEFSPAPSPTPHYVSVDMGENYLVHGLQIVGSSQYDTQNPKVITIQVSKDGKNWSGGETFNTGFEVGGKIKGYFYLSHPQKGQYFKIIIKKDVKTPAPSNLAEVYAF